MKISQLLRAALHVAPTNHEKYYLNTVRFARQDHGYTIEATDGVMALQVIMPEGYAGENLLQVGEQVLFARDSLRDAVDLGTRGPLRLLATPGDPRWCLNGKPIDTVDANYPKLLTIKKSEGGRYLYDTDRLCTLLEATHILREGCKGNVSMVSTASPLRITGHHDDIDYIAFLAPVES